MTNYSCDGSALDYALSAMSEEAPSQTGRARAAMDVLLQGLRTSAWTEVAWAFSELTPDGFPVELTFSSLPGDTVRYVLEVAGPEMPEHSRVAEAFRLYQTLVGHPASAEVELALLKMQGDRELSYGAWFGGAHGVIADRYKIYAEIPKDVFLPEHGLVPCAFQQGLPLPHCHPVPVMFGFQPDTDVREVYFRATGLAPEDMGRLLWSNGLGRYYQEALELIQAACGRPRPMAAIEGFSLAFDLDRHVRAISLFAESAVLFGNDANVRSTLLPIAHSRNWAFTLYERATKVLAGREDLRRHQGVVAWIVSDHNPVEFRVGLRAPEPDITDRDTAGT